MAGLEISLLGQLRVVRSGQALGDLAYGKVWALLAYLVVEAHQSWPREMLAAMLWPEQPEAAARHGLRQALTTLRRTTGDADVNPPCLLISRDTIGFNRASEHWLDLAEFTAILDACDHHAHRRPEMCPSCAERMESAVALYRGDFLAGFAPVGGEVFDEWSLIWRERLRRRYLDALTWLATYHEGRGTNEEARRLLECQLTLEPWRESAHRQLMRVLWKMGERAAALAQYERCRQILAAELDVEPDAATSALHAEIRASRTAVRSQRPIAPAKGDHNLPEPVTPFVGRSREREEIAEVLTDPGCRLVTLTGPGGIGKTRLALQAARDRIADFADGVCFVPLAPVGSVAFLVPAIADALGLSLHEHAEPREQLINRLRDHDMLLVLDNFEHLIAGADIVAELLARAPRLTVLVTSRERLAVRGEWVVPVDGLAVPHGEPTDGFEGYGAVELFLQGLRRTRGQAPLRPEERVWVVRICRLVEGMPLALEMAAAWTGVLTLPEISAEMERDLGFLTTSLRDVPEQHRSMRAVFDRSWALLSAEERALFCRLSVFRGGFTRQAALDVAGASLATLSTLVAKSFVRATPAGRYDLHELLRQYGAEQLKADAEESWQAHERHSSYYLDFLHECERGLIGADQQRVVIDIEAELDNIRAAWQWAVQEWQAAKIRQAAHPLWLFYTTEGRVWDGAVTFARAARRLQPAGDAAAEMSKEQALALGTVHMYRGAYECRLGKYDQAEELLNTAIAAIRLAGAPQVLGLALNLRAMVERARGQIDAERALLEESLALFRGAGDDWGALYSLNDLAMVAHLHGDDDDAQRLGQEALALARTTGDRRGQAFALHHLGLIASDLGQTEEARHWHLASLELRQAAGDQWGMAVSLNQLGRICRATGDTEAARTYLIEALRTALDGGVMPIVAETLVQLAALEVSDSVRSDRVRPILAAVVAHPAAEPRVRTEAAHLLSKCGQPGDMGTPPSLIADDATSSIETLARLILSDAGSA